jgi:hypothetical protein
MRSLIILSLLAATAVVSCDKKDECQGGSGGNLTLVLFPQHHGKAIASQANYRDTIYIKYNTLNAPAAGTAYDLVVVGEEGENHVHVPGLKCGNYYAYAVGFDTSISQRVKGAVPIVTSQTSGELDINVPVSE